MGSTNPNHDPTASHTVPAREPTPRTATDPYATQLCPGDGSAAPNGTPSAERRYRVLRPHARGGLGEVFVALDEELHREVALKEILSQHADHPDRQARFVQEAEITGNLEHPGVVPVYGLGRHADGRPFYAMRFIRGDSLQQAIERFHQGDREGRDPGQRALELRHLLGHFVAVCNTIAYAHSRGVLHRDIKPANILLGDYGETLVVDWGIAKATQRPEPPTADDPAQDRGSGPDPTRVGQIIGTPVYMSPEQARGELDRLGPAADVYSLGATLYCLLTGQAPFAGAEIHEILYKVATSQLTPPRQVNRAVPPALEAVCLEAMAPRPEERYASPRALADDIEHWLADEPVSAYREPLPTRLARWARRHKPLMAAAAMLVLVVAALLPVALVLRQHQQQERAALQLRAATAEEEARRNAAAAVREDQRERAMAQSQLGDVSLALGDLKAARAAYEQAVAIRQQVVRADPDDAQSQRDLGVAHLRLGDVSLALGDLATARTSYQEAERLAEGFAAQNPDSPYTQVGLLVTASKLALLELRAGQPDAARPWVERTLTILRQLQKEDKLKSPHVPLMQLLERVGALLPTTPKPLDRPAGSSLPLRRPGLELLGAHLRELARRGGHAEAAAHVEKADLLLPRTPANLYRLAAGYALCAQAIAPTQTAAADQKARARYSARAMELLEEARERGYFTEPGRVEQLRTDRDFDAIRPSAEFVKLLRALEEKP